MITVTFMIGSAAMCDGYMTVEFITDDNGLNWLNQIIEELYWQEDEFIVLKNGVPYEWNLYIICKGPQ